MEERMVRLREGMAHVGADAFFSLSPSANAYLAGFRGSTSALVVTHDAAHFLCDFRYTEQAEAQVRGCEVTEVTGALEPHVGERLKALGARQAVFDPTAHTVDQLDRVRGAYGGDCVSNSRLVADLRMIKSRAEIECIRRASRLAEGVLADMTGNLGSGQTEQAVAARIDYEFKLRGAEGASFAPIVLFGPRSSLPHGMPGARTPEKGDVVLIDMGCVLDGYCSDLTRTFTYGTIPGTWFEEIYTITLNAQQAALGAVKPGVGCAEVDAVARAIISDAGYGDQFGHGLGHGVGLEVHEAPRLNRQSDTMLRPGMVVTVEPGIYLPGKGGVRIEDLVVVTEDGCEILTRSSKELEVLIA